MVMQCYHPLCAQAQKNPCKVDSFDIGWELVMNLVRTQTEARPRVGLHSSPLCKMSFILGKEVELTLRLTNTDMLLHHCQAKQRCEMFV